MSRFVVILLAGGLRTSDLHQSLGFPVPGLPLEPRRTVLQAWIDVLRADHRLLDASLVLTCSSEGDREWFSAEVRRMTNAGPIEVMLDRRPHRGVGGLVADTISERDPDLDVMVVEVTTLPPPSVSNAIDALRDASALVVGASLDDRPAGVVVLKRRVLEIVPRIGYLDLKEQFIPQAVARGFRAVPACVTSTAVRLSDRRNYLRAVRIWQERGPTSEAERRLPFVSAGSSVVCDGAVVHERAVIRDSVVLPGAVIASGAVVARSVVGPLIRIPENTIVVDGVVADPSLARRRPEMASLAVHVASYAPRAVPDWSHGL